MLASLIPPSSSQVKQVSACALRTHAVVHEGTCTSICSLFQQKPPGVSREHPKALLQCQPALISHSHWFYTSAWASRLLIIPLHPYPILPVTCFQLPYKLHCVTASSLPLVTHYLLALQSHEQGGGFDTMATSSACLGMATTQHHKCTVTQTFQYTFLKQWELTFTLTDRQEWHRWPNHPTCFKTQAWEAQNQSSRLIPQATSDAGTHARKVSVNLPTCIGYSFQINTTNTGEPKFICEVSCREYGVEMEMHSCDTQTWLLSTSSSCQATVRSRWTYWWSWAQQGWQVQFHRSWHVTLRREKNVLSGSC